MNVGFIGVGRMGNHMARHLAEKGHQVAVYDAQPRQCRDRLLEALGKCELHAVLQRRGKGAALLLPVQLRGVAHRVDA